MIDMDPEKVLKNPALWDQKTLEWARSMVAVREAPRRDCSFRCAICDDGLRACSCAYGHHNEPIRTVQTEAKP